MLLAVELLLFELKPRSLIPVALAAAVAALVRTLLRDTRNPLLSLGPDPLFAMIPPHGQFGLNTLLSCVVVGLLGGLMSLLLTGAVYAAEDGFFHLPVHWMWWPAIGGLVIGIGGYFQPHALGVGYDNIEQLIQGGYPNQLVWLMIVKSLIWAIALGSGTSGGVLAPLLIMGGALGALESHFLPGGDNRLWPLVSMAAVMGGTMRSPLTASLFALELTYDMNALLPLLTASIIAHMFTVLVMKRSILTEKVARRGFHVSREYTVDPLERLCVSEVMTTKVVTVSAALSVKELLDGYFLSHRSPRHQAYPVLDEKGDLVGVVTRANLLEDWVAASIRGDGAMVIEKYPIITYDLLSREPITVYPWESCRTAAERMAEAGVGRLPVVSPTDPNKVIGMVTRSDLLKPRARHVAEEIRRERFLGLRSLFGRRKRPSE